jgi:hypothetical protein
MYGRIQQIKKVQRTTKTTDTVREIGDTHMAKEYVKKEGNNMGTCTGKFEGSKTQRNHRVLV